MAKYKKHQGMFLEEVAPAGKKKVSKKKTSAGETTVITVNPVTAWFAVGKVDWIAGKITCLWIEANPNHRYGCDTTGQYVMMPGPHYDGRTTADARSAMRWRSRVAAAKWLRGGKWSGRGELNTQGFRVWNLQSLNMLPEHLK